MSGIADAKTLHDVPATTVVENQELIDTRLGEGSYETALTTAAAGGPAFPLDQLKRLDCMLQSAPEEYPMASAALRELVQGLYVRIDAHILQLKDLNNILYTQILSSP